MAAGLLAIGGAQHGSAQGQLFEQVVLEDITTLGAHDENPLKVGIAGGEPVATLLRFDLSSIPVDSVIHEAALTMHVFGVSGFEGGEPIIHSLPDGSWSENDGPGDRWPKHIHANHDR